jgi:hypothetical protein
MWTVGYHENWGVRFLKLDKLFEDAVSEKQSGKLEGFLASHK